MSVCDSKELGYDYDFPLGIIFRIHQTHIFSFKANDAENIYFRTRAKTQQL